MRINTQSPQPSGITIPSSASSSSPVSAGEATPPLPSIAAASGSKGELASLDAALKRLNQMEECDQGCIHDMKQALASGQIGPVDLQSLAQRIIRYHSNR